MKKILTITATVELPKGASDADAGEALARQIASAENQIRKGYLTGEVDADDENNVHWAYKTEE